MTTQMRNGARPSLASQIDRLGATIDGFADALSGSVAEAVQQGLAGLHQPLHDAARQAVREALADPGVWPATRPQSPLTTALPQDGHIGPLVRAALWLEGAGTTVAQKCQVWFQASKSRAQKSGQELWQFCERAWLALLMLSPLAWMLRWHFLVAAGASLLLGVVVLVAGPV